MLDLSGIVFDGLTQFLGHDIDQGNDLLIRDPFWADYPQRAQDLVFRPIVGKDQGTIGDIRVLGL
jgi:hypothetical protein